MLKKDSWILGIILGLLLPAILWFIAYYAYVQKLEKIASSLVPNTQLLCIAINGLIFRIYMVNWKLDKTGRGILLATFIYALFYIVSNDVI